MNKKFFVLAFAFASCWVAYKVIKKIIKETELDKNFDIDFS